MNTDALFVGMNIKNYKELCMLTNEETKTGKSKILQLENFSRFINWHKIGQKFIIDEIYDSPKEKQDKRSSGNNNVYCKYIEIILLNHLNHCDDNVNSLTFCKWYEILGMVGHDYNKYYSDMDKLLEFENNLDIQNIKDFYMRSGMRMRKILLDSLRNLQKRKLISFEEEMIVTYKTKYGSETIVAGDIEKEDILNTEYEILHDELKLNNIFQVYLKGLQDTYYKRVQEKIFDLYGYTKYYRRVKIISVKKSIIRSEIYLDKIKMAKEILNNHIVEFIDHDAYMKEKGNRWVNNNYTEAQMYLSNKLIKLQEET